MMKPPETDTVDSDMMRRCIARSAAAVGEGEYPYAAVICRNGQFVCEAINAVARERDVTRHAEVAAIAQAQKVLGRTSLDDCTIYTNAEPCALCCYAIRESRIGRVVYGIWSPLMGGHSRWNILADNRLSDAMPEVFAPPPEIVAGYLRDEVEEVFKRWNPLIWKFISERGLFVAGAGEGGHAQVHVIRRQNGLKERLMAIFRRTVIDRVGRR
jgi:tRNA(adenine34) deaminase